jgi:hypothetical protein
MTVAVAWAAIKRWCLAAWNHPKVTAFLAFIVGLLGFGLKLRWEQRKRGEAEVEAKTAKVETALAQSAGKEAVAAEKITQAQIDENTAIKKAAGHQRTRRQAEKTLEEIAKEYPPKLLIVAAMCWSVAMSQEQVTPCEQGADMSGLVAELERVAATASGEHSCTDVIVAGKLAFPDAYPVCRGAQAITSYGVVREQLCGSVSSLLDSLAAVRVQRDEWKTRYEIKVADVDLLKEQWQDALRARVARRNALIACGAGAGMALEEDGNLAGRLMLACLIPFASFLK